MTDCPHEAFEANVEVHRLTAEEGGPVIAYAAEVKVRCRQCTEPFTFIGVPLGVNPRRPTGSLDGTELRAPIRPASSPPLWGEDGPGFSVRVN